MTNTLFALYSRPDDTVAFDHHYEATHSKLVQRLPGLRSFSGTHLGPSADGSLSQYYFVAVLSFGGPGDLDAALASSEGAATVEDLANFAEAGVMLIHGSTVTYR